MIHGANAERYESACHALTVALRVCIFHLIADIVSDKETQRNLASSTRKVLFTGDLISETILPDIITRHIIITTLN